MSRIRCGVGERRPAPMSPYHDDEWGVPVRDDRRLSRDALARRCAGGPELVHHPEEARGVSPCLRRLRPRTDRPLRTRRRSLRCWRTPAIVRQPPQGAGRDRQRACVARSARGRRRVLRLPLGARRRRAGRQRVATPGGCPRRDPRLRGDEQGTETLRVPVRRPYHLLRLHAGGGDGQRPRHLVLFAGTSAKGAEAAPELH